MKIPSPPAPSQAEFLSELTSNFILLEVHDNTTKRTTLREARAAGSTISQQRELHLRLADGRPAPLPRGPVVVFLVDQSGEAR